MILSTLLVGFAALGVHAAPSLHATPAAPVGSMDKITLTWAGVTAMTPNYTIGLYAGNWVDAAGLVHGRNHIGEIPVGHVGGPDGKIEVSMVNVRQNYTFVLYPATGWDPKKPLATSNAVNFQKEFPTQPRLALTKKPDEMLVMFTTNAALSPPTVRLGLTKECSDASFTGESDAPFAVKDMCNEPANLTKNFLPPGIQHRVLLTGLTANTTYFYQLGGGDVWGDVLQFVSSPGIGPMHTTALLFGDMGTTIPFTVVGSSYSAASQTIARMAELIDGFHGPSPSLVVHIGDLSYARGYPITWEWFMNNISPLSSALPYMVGIGNHEFDYKGFGQAWVPAWSNYGLDSGGECGVHYSARFSMPPPPATYAPAPTGRPNNNNLWYSFDQGAVHYLMMSSEHDFEAGSTQRAFLEADLAAVDRKVTPWVIFMGHRPMYTTEVGEGGQTALHLRAALEPLFQKYEVDIALWAHVHKYERMCNIVHDGICGATPKNGTVHLVIGNAGNDYQSNWASTSAHHFPVQEYLIFRTFGFGFCFLEADVDFLTFSFLGDESGVVHDSFTLRK